LSFHGIGPGESWLYRFQVRQAGTYWYHAHSSLQEAVGVYGAIVIEPREPDPVAADRDHVILLSDWSDEDPHAIVRKLCKQADYYNLHKRTVGDLLRDARRDGWDATLSDRKAWGRMRMSPTDLADVNATTYTYLTNGTTPAGNWTALFGRGEKVRLRFINASAMTYFDVRIPGLKMTVVAADGQPVHPVTVDEFRLPVAETLDVVVEPEDARHGPFDAGHAGRRHVEASCQRVGQSRRRHADDDAIARARRSRHRPARQWPSRADAVRPEEHVRGSRWP
jgi:CopA family copper-resistance protein